MNTIKFSELALSNELQEAIAEMGFEEATPIQAEAIPHIMEGKDIIGQAQTGTGKTAAFGIPLIDRLDASDKSIQALVMCPTRELAVQVANEFKKLLKYKKGINCIPVYGGESIERQISALKRGVQVIIGTPGRVMDHMDRGTISFDKIKMVVLDEADEMLNMGFRDDIEAILSDMPDEKQTIFFSATMPKPILELTKRYQHAPVIVKITRTELTNTLIEQEYFDVKQDFKVTMMTNLIEAHNLQLMLVFCNTKRGVDEVVEELNLQGYKAEALHGDLKQAQRNNVMGKFRKGLVNILVATDVAARGIDVDNVDGVFNYDVPLDVEYYVHRIGRTGRAGKSGKAFTFVTGRREYMRLQDIERYAKIKINKGQAPSSKQLFELKQNKLLSQLQNLSDTSDLSAYHKILNSYIEQGHSLENIAAALLRLTIGEMKKEERRADREDSSDRYERRDRDRTERSGRREFGDKRRESGSEKRGTKSFRRNEGMVRLFVNVGKMDRVSAGDLVGAFTGEANIDSNQIGMIEIYDKYSFVEVSDNSVNDIMDGMSNSRIKGRKVNIEIANPKA
ncbi:MAG TPA: DEAD/DEAH box helicase [Cytophagaceae bacterium]|jgi:ATP-dependent RNA helicase DeaD|nr:DEAD/DEAH box helicase [Cytophagaceae bacterium]